MSKVIINWFTKHEKRKRGGSYTRWVDDIKAAAGGTWSRMAKEAFVKMRHGQ